MKFKHLIMIVLLTVMISNPVWGEPDSHPKMVDIWKSRMYVDDRLYEAKHVVYIPLRKGEFYTHSKGVCRYDESKSDQPYDCYGADKNIYDLFPERLAHDLDLIKSMNGNGVRTREPVTKTLLDALNERDMMVAASFPLPHGVEYSDPEIRQKLKDKAVAYVREFKHHPAILFWILGNETERYIDYYEINAYFELIEEIALEIRKEDPYHPVSVATSNVYELIWKYTKRLTSIQIWTINVYLGESFNPPDEASLWQKMANATYKALYIGEYGVDAYHHTDVEKDFQGGHEDEEGHARIVANLAREIRTEVKASYSKKDKKGRAIGGAYYSFCDQWWRNHPWTDDTLTLDIERDGWDRPGHDNYEDVEWNGIFKDESTPEHPMRLKPRRVYDALKEVWDDTPPEKEKDEGDKLKENESPAAKEPPSAPKQP